MPDYWDTNGGLTNVELDKEKGTLKVGNDDYSYNKWTSVVSNSSGKVGCINHRGEVDFDNGRNLHA